MAECGETIAVLTEAVCTANGKSETQEVEDPASTGDRFSYRRVIDSKHYRYAATAWYNLELIFIY